MIFGVLNPEKICSYRS